MRQSTRSRNVPYARSATAVLVLVLSGCNATSSSPSPQSAGAHAATTPTPAAGATPSANPEPSIGGLPVGRIVFDRYRDGPEGTYLDTFILDASGTETRLDIPNEAVERRAAWSPDATSLLVDSWAEDIGSSVGIYVLATGTYTALDHGLEGDVTCSDWAPNGLTVICSVSSATEADDGIYAVDVASGSVTRLTHSEFHFVEGTAGACGGGENRAVYSPDGTRFAYQQQKCGTGADPSADETGAVAIADADGSNPDTVVPFGGVLTHPGGEISWSPVADRIAFGTPDGRLRVIAADGTGLETIRVPVPGFVFGPTWSPDGAWILVSIATDSAVDLYAVAVDGSHAVQVTDSSEDEVYTDWTAGGP